MRADPEQERDIGARARYCQMLAGRLKLPPVQSARLVMAAWLSIFENMKELTARLRQQYQLDHILFPAANAPEIPEAKILQVVRCFQDLKKADRRVGADIAVTNKRLKEAWATTPEREEVLARFIHVLSDEQFLSDFDRAAGRILIVHPDEPVTGLVSLPLRGEGYEVEAVHDSAEAALAIKKHRPDLLVVAARLPEVEGLMINGIALCEQLKNFKETAKIPVIMLAGKGKANLKKCLRAGADDSLSEPPDLELLSHRIRRLIAPRLQEEKQKAGVAGSFADMHFTDMIQIFSAGGRSMKIDLARDGQQAVIYIQNGDIVHAALGPLEGEKAFYELMRWMEGAFEAVQCDAFPPRTIHASTISLLMEGARLVDEKGV